MMRIIQRLSLLLCFATILSCGHGWYADKTNNIELSDFTKELITLYLNDSLVISYNEDCDEVNLICETDSLYYYLFLYMDKSQIYKRICYECFVGNNPYLGKTYYNNLSIRVFGEELPMFFSTFSKAPDQGRCRTEYWEYDPIEWTIVFDRDSSLCLDKTMLFLEETDISPVVELAEKHF